MKKFLSLIASCTICFATVFAAGCKKGSSAKVDTSSPSQAVESLEMENTNVLLTLGDKVELSVFYQKVEGETLTWSSSSPSIVSVDQNGNIEGLKVGKATVTASYGSKQVSCKVEVSLSGNVPMLVFNDNVGEEITVMKGTGLALGACVKFNGKTFNDGEIEYFVADQTIGSIENGMFVAKETAGTTQVSVFATWRGQTVYAKTITVNVIAESTVLLNNGRLNSIDLYMVEEHEGKEYSTTQTISSVMVSENGTEITDYTLSVLDEGIATIEQSNGVWNVVAKKAGKTNLVVSYGDQEFPFELVVRRPVKELDMTVDYSILEGQYFDSVSKSFKPVSEMIDGFADIVSYEFAGKEYKVKDGVLAIPEGENYAITFYNEKAGYQIELNSYTMILDELKDFEKIYAGDATTDVKGLYMLGKDIIEPDTVLSMPTGKVPNNFAGTFDGRGHVLSFTFEHGSKHCFGLFGMFLKGATIKNLALNNITKSGTAGKNPSGIICYNGSDGASTTGYSTIENVFVDLKFTNPGASNLAFMGNAMWATILKNVIIHVPEVPIHDTYGSFARGEVASVSNSYVISTAPLYVTVQPTNYRIVPTLYSSYAEMKMAGHDYTSFSAEYWDVTTHGVPVWKTLVNDFTN